MPYVRHPVSEAIGKKFGRLTIIADEGKGFVRTRCECGTEKVLLWMNVYSGRTKSCGCLHRENGGFDKPAAYYYQGVPLNKWCGGDKSLYNRIMYRVRAYGESVEDAVKNALA